MIKKLTGLRPLLLVTAAVLVYLSVTTGQVRANACIPGGGVDDTLNETECCSGMAVPGSTWCLDPADFGTTWASCSHICLPDCAEFDYEGCHYSWDAASQCCLAPPPSPETVCLDACF